MTTLTVGLTGGIGSGKSTVAKYFAALGIEVIDTDKIAYEIVRPGTPALAKIKAHYGTQILNDDGTLNRGKLKQHIFADQNERLWLESLLHPLILKEMLAQIKQAQSPYVIVAIPLLVETGSTQHLDRILVIDCPNALQMERTQQRDQLSKTQIEAILKTQATRQQRLALADDVIHNEGSLAELKQQVLKQHQCYMKLSKKRPNA